MRRAGGTAGDREVAAAARRAARLGTRLGTRVPGNRRCSIDTQVLEYSFLSKTYRYRYPVIDTAVYRSVNIFKIAWEQKAHVGE